MQNSASLLGVLLEDQFSILLVQANEVTLQQNQVRSSIDAAI